MRSTYQDAATVLGLDRRTVKESLAEMQSEGFLARRSSLHETAKRNPTCPLEVRELLDASGKTCTKRVTICRPNPLQRAHPELASHFQHNPDDLRLADQQIEKQKRLKEDTAAHPTPPALTSPGLFEEIKPHGKGGMGRVYIAREPL